MCSSMHPSTDILQLTSPRIYSGRHESHTINIKDARSPVRSLSRSSMNFSAPASFDWSNSPSDGLEHSKRCREKIGLRMLKAMDANGANVSKFTTIGGRTALMFAVICGDLNTVKLLINKNADPLETNERGETPISLAKGLLSNKIYMFLLEKIPKQYEL